MPLAETLVLLVAAVMVGGASCAAFVGTVVLTWRWARGRKVSDG